MSDTNLKEQLTKILVEDFKLPLRLIEPFIQKLGPDNMDMEALRTSVANLLIDHVLSQTAPTPVQQPLESKPRALRPF